MRGGVGQLGHLAVGVPLLPGEFQGGVRRGRLAHGLS